MGTEEYETNTREEQYMAPVATCPEELWLDEDISDELLIELDPLEETEDLVALADEGTGAGSVLRSLPKKQWSDGLWQIMWRVIKAELQTKHGHTETPAEFIARLRGSK